MSGKKKAGKKKLPNLVLTPREAYELKWFCQNVVGVRGDFYEILDKVNTFNQRLIRLEGTCKLIEKHFGEKLKEPETFMVRPHPC